MKIDSPHMQERKSTLKTKDLWQSAFLLAQGTDLLDVVLKKNRFKKEVMFIFEGEDVSEHIQEFRRGRAVCNVTHLKASMNHLKEEMFKIMNA